MANLRNVMLVAVLAATALAAIAAYLLLGGSPARLLVDAGLASALGIIVHVTLSPTVHRVDAMVEALRALARGDRHQRVNPDEFAGLADVARALNEVAASLTEGEDPNLGPVRSTPRPGRPTRRELPDVGDRSVPEPQLSDHPEIGQVRVIKKAEKKAEPKEAAAKDSAKKEPAAKEAAAKEAKAKNEPPAKDPAAREAAASPSASDAPAAATADGKSDGKPAFTTPPAKDIDAAARDASARPEQAEPSNDTAIDDAPRPEASGPPSDVASMEPEIARIPSRAELEALFQEFVAAKKSKDESVVDLDLDAFAQTIQGECERLIVAHQCKGVRFEVTMQDGEVSLRPRLLR